MMHPKNAQQIQAATGLPEHHWSQNFMSEYMTQLRMYHRLHSGGGPLPPEILIPLMRQFSMESPSQKKAEREKIRWETVPTGTKIEVIIGGHRKSGVFQQLVSGGTLAVKIDGHARVLELPPTEVRLDRSIPEDIRQSTMKDDFSEPSPKKAETLPQETPTIPVTDWKKVPAHSTIEVDGEWGVFVGVTPKKKMKLTVEVNGEIRDVPRHTVKLIDTIIPDLQKAEK
jgi:hypothetical protein